MSVSAASKCIVVGVIATPAAAFKVLAGAPVSTVFGVREHDVRAAAAGAGFVQQPGNNKRKRDVRVTQKDLDEFLKSKKLKVSN